MKLKILAIDYHRNGVGGNGFYAVLFKEGRGKTADHKIATVFPDKGNISVLSVDLLAQKELGDGKNRWRAEDYEPEIRDAIRQWQFDTWGWTSENDRGVCENPAGIDDDGRCIKCGLPACLGT
jgi:hypothetical protein